MQTNAVMKDPKDSPPETLEFTGARQRFLANISSGVALTVFQALVSFWFTPYLIHHLGIAAFGMVPLVSSVIAYVEMFTSSFNSAVSRFLTVDLQRGDRLAANKTFNTAFFGIVGTVVALIPIVLILSLAFPYIFATPVGGEKDASWLFAAAGVTLFISMITSNFAVSSFAYSRFLARNALTLIALLTRIGLVVTLFSFFSARLWHVGGGLIAAASISFLGHVFLWRRLTPLLSVQISAFDRSRLKSVMGMGGWVVVDRVGAMLLKRTDLLVVNLFFGAAMTGNYGSVLQFSTLISSLAISAGSVLSPAITMKYAERDFVGLKRLSYQSVRLLGLGLALPIGLLCGFSHPLLSIWLGPSFADLDTLLIFLVAHLTLNLGVLPFGYVHSALNRVRWPGIATLIAGGANLGLAILLSMWGKWGIVGVAIAGAAVWTTKNTLFFPVYTAHILKLPWWSFLPSLSAGVIGTTCVALTAYGLTFLRMPNNWFELAGSAAIVSLLYAAGASVIGLNRTDWQLIKSLLPQRKSAKTSA